MKLSVIREALMKEAGIAALVAVVAGGIAGYSVYYRQSEEDKLAKMQRDLALTNNRIVKLEEENDEALKLFSRLARVPATKRTIQMNDLPSRIQLLQPMLEDLKVRYRMPKLDISLTNVSTMGPAYTKGSYETMFSTITITFGALSDEMVLSLLKELTQSLPGYVRFESLDLVRTQNISVSAYNQVKQRTIPTLVSGKVLISWKTIRQK